jgi:hypothetical protein
MSKSLAARSAVATGAARGIGDAIAERLLADGANVFSLDKVAAADRARASSIWKPMSLIRPASLMCSRRLMRGLMGSTSLLTTPASSTSALSARFRSPTSRRSSRPISADSSCARPKLSRGWRPAAKAARSSASHRPRRLSGSRDGRHIARQRLEFSSSPGR